MIEIDWEEAKRFSLKQRVYDLMCGEIELDSCQVDESEYVTNEFAPGTFCNQAYEDIFEANERLCERLGVAEDADIEFIINRCLEIAKHLSMKMYDYGEFFSKK